MTSDTARSAPSKSRQTSRQGQGLLSQSDSAFPRLIRSTHWLDMNAMQLDASCRPRPAGNSRRSEAEKSCCLTMRHFPDWSCRNTRRCRIQLLHLQHQRTSNGIAVAASSIQRRNCRCHHAIRVYPCPMRQLSRGLLRRMRRGMIVVSLETGLRHFPDWPTSHRAAQPFQLRCSQDLQCPGDTNCECDR
jgi:hypothetical protein